MSCVCDIGHRIKERRLQLGLNAEQLADKVGMSAATVYRYENGDIKKVNTNKLSLFAQALNTSEAYLMGWTNSQEFPVDVVKETENASVSIPEIESRKNISECTNESRTATNTNRIESVFSEGAIAVAINFDSLTDSGKELIVAAMTFALKHHKADL